MEFKLLVKGNSSQQGEKSVVVDTYDIEQSMKDFNEVVSKVTNQGKYDYEVIDIPESLTQDEEKLNFSWEVVKSMLKFINENGVEDFLDVMSDFEDSYLYEDIHGKVDELFNKIEEVDGFDFDDVPSLPDKQYLIMSPDGKSFEGRPKVFFDSFIYDIYEHFDYFIEKNIDTYYYYVNGKCLMNKWIEEEGQDSVRETLGLSPEEELPDDIYDLIDQDEIINYFDSSVIRDCFDEELFIEDLESQQRVYHLSDFSVIVDY